MMIKVEEIIVPGTIAHHVWNDKYRYRDESVLGTFRRVAHAIAGAENLSAAEAEWWENEFFNVMNSLEFLPGGRILAGAGTDRDVTLFNCFVMGTIPDSLEGIFTSLREAALTLKSGGGVGMDFSTLRPRGAYVAGVDSGSSGAVSFMECWDTMCKTIMSAGNRRGAMMGTLRCDHPDIEEFIEAKTKGGKLTNFNISVGITDEFIKAVYDDHLWTLKFDGVGYKDVIARELWDKIMRSTYECADPGVLFLDRVNKTNPLRDIETIAVSNPCGEQMLPPYGACLLGSINLAQMVINPFAKNAVINFKRLEEVTKIAVRFLDNVIDVSNFPLGEQETEAQRKRRIGLGVTGFGDLLAMLGVGYDTQRGREIGGRIMEVINDNALDISIKLGAEKGIYPAWNISHGSKRRNSHLLSIAPTGTISLLAGNVSSGIEPIFALTAKRKLLQADGTRLEVEVRDYAMERYPDSEMDWKAWKTAEEIRPEDHLAMVAVFQPYVDSAISKTINCPRDISYEDFREIYVKAYKLGLKGCTTYRPNDISGSVLDAVKPDSFDPGAALEKAIFDKKPLPENFPWNANNGAAPGFTHAHIYKDTPVEAMSRPQGRPDEVHGTTYKLKPPGAEHALYVTINHVLDIDGMRPFEIFFNTKQVESWPWMTALSRMLSAVFRKGGDVSFVIEELKAVFDPRGGFWKPGQNGEKGRHVPSVIAGIGDIIEQHLISIGYTEGGPYEGEEITPKQYADAMSEQIQTGIEEVRVGADVYEAQVMYCPKCQSGHLYKVEGCLQCNSCTFTKC
jgi:ribonucleoside-diphosphate reductase alpha chain